MGVFTLLVEVSLTVVCTKWKRTKEEEEAIIPFFFNSAQFFCSQNLDFFVVCRIQIPLCDGEKRERGGDHLDNCFFFFWS